MIEDARRIDQPELNADVVIVGSGPAGFAVASRLLASRQKVIIVEAGGALPDPEGQQQYWRAGDESLPGHPPLHLYRRRALGGTSTVWGGRCVPLDQADFEAIPGVRPETWPISYSSLSEFYPAAMDFLDAGRFEFDDATALPGSRPNSQLGGGETNFSRIDRFSLPTNVARKFSATVTAAKNAQLLLNAPCVEIITTPDARKVTGVRCIAAGRDLHISAPFVVLANGGLESTRLLLLSNSVRPNGLGNESHLLGTHYMTHLTGELGHLAFRDNAGEALLELKRTADGIYCQRTVQLPAEVRRRRSMMNFVLRPTFNDAPDPRHNNAALSMYFLARRFMSPEQRHKFGLLLSRTCENPRDLERISRRHRAIVLRQLPRALRFSAWWVAAKRMKHRRVPLLFVQRAGRYPLEYISEQKPSAQSRVFLSESRDPLGMRRLAVQWQPTDDDRNTIKQGYELMRDELKSRGNVALVFDDDEMDDALRHARPSGGHHMGTARMSDSERTGVVGPNCEVWGTNGLFVASGSVFPTSGAANPTLTIVALSLRIAEHLAALVKSR